MLRTTSLTVEEYEAFLQGWANRFLASGGHWRISGRPVMALNNLYDFVQKYGQTVFDIMLRYAVQSIAEQIGITPYLLGVIGQANPANLRLACELPLDGVTGYGLLPNWLGPPVQRYAELIEQRVVEWDAMQRRLSVPFFPVVCTGWDATVRGEFKGVLRAEDGYPHSPVVTGVTPALFGSFLDRALDFNRRWRPRENIVFLHAWNEWTEASVLEPNDRFGSALLEEVRRRSSMPGAVSMMKLAELE